MVKANVKPSKINGLGLFADENISKGTITWKYNKVFDISFEPEEVKKMPQNQQDLIYKYSFLSMTTGKYIFCIDDSRFTNHSSKNGNIENIDKEGEIEALAIASRDIEIGEELLINYRDFDKNDVDSKEKYLNN